MANWVVETLDKRVDREIEDLPADIRAALARISELIETLGPAAVREPYVKHLDGPIWEMRPRGRGGIARALHVTWIGSRVIILRVFAKKTQTVPRRQIEIALERLRDLKARDESP